MPRLSNHLINRPVRPVLRLALVLALAALAGLSNPTSALAQNWPAWRGPYGTGIPDTKDIKEPPLKWTDKQNVRWRVALPDRGNSTPIVWGDRVFVTQAIEKENRRTLMCFARADGKLIWQSGVVYEAHEPTNGQNPYCSASPVTDGTRVFAYFASAGIYCYDLDGKEIWHRDLGKADSWHGSGSSPVLYDDLCIINAGPGTDAAVIALNKKTGDEVWRVISKNAAPELFALLARGFAPRGGAGAAPDAGGAGSKFDGAATAVDMSGAGGFLGSWSTPIVVKVADEGAGHDELIVPMASNLCGYDPATGRELWTCEGMASQVYASPTTGDGVLLALGNAAPMSSTRPRVPCRLPCPRTPLVSVCTSSKSIAVDSTSSASDSFNPYLRISSTGSRFSLSSSCITLTFSQSRES